MGKTAEERFDDIDAAFRKGDMREHFILMCTTVSDYFARGYIGYWAQGIERSEGQGGWLLRQRDAPLAAAVFEDWAVKAWKGGEPLPEFYHRLDRETASEAYDAGVKQWGEAWYEDHDGDSIDYVLQMAILGEVTYG